VRTGTSSQPQETADYREEIAREKEELSALWSVRDARTEDTEAVAEILAESFPGLYRAVFGALGTEEVVWLLTALYEEGILSLDAMRVYERGGRVVGLAALHTDAPLAHGSLRRYWNILCRELEWQGAPRAFFGGLATYLFLTRRLPQAPDLVYIKTLAVAAAERGQGIGTRLLEDAARWTLAQGRTYLALNVLHSNTGARRLYARTGFQPWQSDSYRSLSHRLLARFRPDWAGLLLRCRAEDLLAAAQKKTEPL